MLQTTTLTYTWVTFVAAAGLKTKQYQRQMKARFELNKHRLYTNMMRHVDSSMYTNSANIKQELRDSIRTLLN